ncbi:hypothetical protein H5410_022831 [Solanum commersonii]|uniref:Uncharacterized protein n=1 Tax=Solanum commersonii TaxID=4109 RepID=A0A9J5ZJR4_SOLCO|nr:hypothetical protein H5410_022831 [Solanum commersonii]
MGSSRRGLEYDDLACLDFLGYNLGFLGIDGSLLALVTVMDNFEEIERIEAEEVANDMSLEFPIIVVDEDDALAKKEDQITQGEPSVSAGATQSSWSAF